jgi:hypothetical protein
VILTARTWRVNLRGGAEVEVVHDGVSAPMRAELIEDPHEVALIYEELLRQIDLSKAKLSIGLEVVGDEIPPEEQIERAVAGRRAVILLRPR